MKRDDWPVGKHGIRPAGRPDRCFYCGAKEGESHRARGAENAFGADGCVIRSKTVVVKATIEMVVDVPEDWDAAAVEFKYNDGSWCAGNIVANLEDMKERIDAADGGCLCPHVRVDFVREATAEDEETHAFFVKDLPS